MCTKIGLRGKKKLWEIQILFVKFKMMEIAWTAGYQSIETKGKI